eukprot:scaffold1637_cov410-Prasinococcus_capsulatus_cf.AAC.9
MAASSYSSLHPHPRHPRTSLIPSKTYDRVSADAVPWLILDSLRALARGAWRRDADTPTAQTTERVGETLLDVGIEITSGLAVNKRLKREGLHLLNVHPQLSRGCRVGCLQSQRTSGVPRVPLCGRTLASYLAEVAQGQA